MSGRTKQKDRRATRPSSVAVNLTHREVEVLVQLADYYQRSMGPIRFIVGLTAAAEVRAKYHFIAEESKWLRRFAEATREELPPGEDPLPISFTPRSLIAFWGRVLASLNTRRSRRRLRPEQVEEREELSRKLRHAAALLARENPQIIEQEIRTRRPVEVAWMRELLTKEDSV